MITIGITGGVGAGKSTVLDFLAEKYQAYVMKADEIGHLVMEPGQECYEPVIALFGKQIIKDDKGTREDQGMLVYVDELAESAVTLGLRVWVPTEDYWTVRWRLNETIKDEFDRQGIRIPYRQLDVHVIS